MALMRRNWKLRIWALCTAASMLLNVMHSTLAFAQIVPDGRTETYVETVGFVTDITTGTVIGQSGLNSFTDFNVDADNVVNMHVPRGAVNLVNLVTGRRRSFIDGTLNAYKDGRIGGNVYFLNPDGIIVGAQGTLNAGALALLTPSRDFVDSFFADGTGGASSLTKVLEGTMPIDPAGLISVRGRVQTFGDVDVRAGDVGIIGDVRTGMVFGGPPPDLADVLNVGGELVPAGAAGQAGHIRIVAEGDVLHVGSLVADGRDGVDGGHITVSAGGNVLLDDGSVTSARGRGADSSAGDVVVFADGDAELGAGATIDARGGDVSGDGSFIEFSAANTVRLGGGSLLAGAGAGRSGSILIDPEELHVIDDQYSDGVHLTLQAAKRLSIADGVTVSTRTVEGGAAGDHLGGISIGDSGDLTFQAPEISVGAGARLLAHATGGHRSGDIVLHATFSHDAKVSQLEFPGAAAKTEIDIAGATLKGRDIRLSAASSARDEWDATSVRQFLDAHMDELGLDADFGDPINNLKGINIGAVLARADADIVIGNGSLLEADGAVTLEATSGAAAVFAPTDIEKSALLGVVYGDVQARAAVDVGAGAAVTARELRVAALNEAELDLPVTAKDMDNVPVAAAVAVGRAQVHSSAVVRAGAALDVQDSITIRAANESSFSLAARATADEGGVLGVSASVFIGQTSAVAELRADVGGGDFGPAGDVQVAALDTVLNSSVTARSTAKEPVGGYDKDDDKDGDENKDEDGDEEQEGGKNDDGDKNDDEGDEGNGGNTPGDDDKGDENNAGAAGEAFVSGVLASRVGDGGDKKVQLDERSGADGGGLPEIGAAVSVALVHHRATGRIGDDVNIDSIGDVGLIARVREFNPRLHAEASVGGGKVASLSGAVAVGLVEHDAEALLGNGASVNAGRIGVFARAERLSDMGGFEWDGLGDVKQSLQDDGDTADGFLSGRASSTGGGGDGGVGITGSVLYVDIDSSARATIGEGGSVDAGAGAGAWETVLHGGGDEEDDDNIEWAAAVALAAETTVAGAFGSSNTSAVGEGKDADGFAIGGSYAHANYSTIAEAVVHDYATVNTVNGSLQPAPGDVSISALTKQYQYALAHGTGGGAGIGINGNFAFGRTVSQTVARIAEHASVGGTRVGLQAEDDLRAFVLAGGFNRPGTNNLSASIALQDLTGKTTAEVQGAVQAVDLSVVAVRGNVIASDVSEMSNSAAVAVTMLDAAVAARLAQNSDIDVTGDVLVHAATVGSFSMTAKATAKDGAAAGIAGALLFAETDTSASVETSLSGATNVYVTAVDAVAKTTIVAETEVEGQKDPKPGDGDKSGSDKEGDADDEDEPGPPPPDAPSTGTRFAAEKLVQDKLSDENLGEKTPQFDSDSGAVDRQSPGDRNGEHDGSNGNGSGSGGQGKEEGKSGLRLPKLGGAVSVGVVERNAQASIADGVQIVASGDVATAAQVVDNDLRQRAETGVVSHGSDKELPVSISAAVVVGLYENEAVASIGARTNVTAANIGLRSDVVRTFDMDWHKWEGVNTIIDKFKNRKNTQGDLVEGYLSGFANSTAKTAGGEYGLAGSVLYLDFVNRSEAYAADEAVLTLREPSAGRWAAPVGVGDDAPTVEWDDPLSVTAVADVHGAFAAGNIDIVLDWEDGSIGGGGGKVNLGASYGQVNHKHSVQAFLGKGVVAGSSLGTDPDVSLAARNDERVFVITPTAGTGSTYGMSGNFALATVDSATRAFIDEGATVDARRLRIAAEENLLSFSIAGAVNIAEGAGVGIGIAVQRVYTDTYAGILSGEGGHRTAVTADSVTVAARTDGIIETISVAGAAATRKDKSAQQPADEDQEKKPGNKGLDEAKKQLLGGVDEVKGLVETAKQLIEAGKTIYEFIQTLGDDTDITQLLLALFDADVVKPEELDLDEFDEEDKEAAQKALEALRDDMHGDEPPDEQRIGGAAATAGVSGSAGGASGSASTAGAAAAPSSANPPGGAGVMNEDEDEGSAPKFGLGISGSASVNVARLETVAAVDGAVVNVRAADGATIRALNATDIGAFSGSASFVRAKRDFKGSAAVAGAAAVNDLQNVTDARLQRARVEGGRNVVVEALASGDQLAIGIGVAVNASGSQDKAGAGAGSVSVSTAGNEVTARVLDSAIEGGDAGSGVLRVAAYDRARLATGGGSAVIGGKGGFGAAVTYSAIKNRAHALVEDSVIGNFAATDVRAFTAAQIVAGGAMIGATNAQGSRTLGGAFVISQIHNETAAEVLDSALENPGRLTVAARDAARDAAETRAWADMLNERGCTADCEGAHEDIVDFDGAGARDWGDLDDPDGNEDDEHEIRPRESLPGSSIIAVAGVAQLSLRGSNVGLATTYSDIANEFIARLADSMVAGAGDVKVAADTYATIMGLSVGAGVGRKFSGGGSLTHNMIRNATTAEVRLGQDVSGNDYKLDAGSLTIGAVDRSEILGVAGMVNVSFGSSSAGFSLTGGVTLNETIARLEANSVNTRGGLSVEADNAARMMAFGITGGVSKDTAIGGSASLALMKNAALAEIAGADGGAASGVSADGNVSVRARNESDIASLSGQVSVGFKGSAVGAAAVANVGLNDTQARIQNVAVHSPEEVAVEAAGDSRIRTVAVSGSVGGGSVAVGASVNASHIQNKSIAEIDGAGIHGVKAGRLTVDAMEESTIHALAGQASISLKGAGVGIGAVYGGIMNESRATVRRADLDVEERAHIHSANEAELVTIGMSVAVGKSAGVGGAVGISLVMNESIAELLAGDGGPVPAVHAGALAVEATDDAAIKVFVGNGAGGGTAAVGAALGHAHTMNETRASLRGVDVDSPGAVRVAASSESDILGIAVGGGVAGKAAVTGSAMSTLVNNRIVAEAVGAAGRRLEADSVSLTALDKSDIQSLAGNVNAAGTAAVGGAFVNSIILNETTATVSEYDVTAAEAASIGAESKSSIESLAVTAGAAGTAAVQGSFVNALVMNTTRATASGASRSFKGANFSLGATDGSSIRTVGGAAGGAGTVAIGAALLHNMIKNETEAALEGYEVDVSGLASVEAMNSSAIENLTVAAAGAGTAAVAGALSSSEILNETRARAAGPAGRSLTAGELRVVATDRSKLKTMSAEATLAGTAAVGGALANNVIANTTAASLSGYGLAGVGAAQVAAENQSFIDTYATAAGGSAKVGVQGSVASAHIHNTTEAVVEDGAATNEKTDLSVRARDAAAIDTVAGAAGVGIAAGGAGGTAAVNTIGNTTRAALRGGQYVVDNVLVEAESLATIGSVAAAMGGGNFVGLAGSTATNFIDNETEAFIDEGAKVLALRNVGVVAESHDVITNLSGALGVGGKGAGVGASVAVNSIGGHTRAYIDGDATKVTALGQGLGLSGLAWGDMETVDLTKMFEANLEEDEEWEWRPALPTLLGRETVHGVAVHAAATYGFANVTGTTGAGGTAGIAGSLGMNVLAGSTEAFVRGASVNADRADEASAEQSVSVKAADHSLSQSFVGSLGAGAGAGVAAGVNTAVFERTTTAYIENSMRVFARGGVNVAATASQASASLAAGFAAGSFGGVGTGNVGLFNSSTEAFVRNVNTLEAGRLTVTGDNEARLAVAAGGAAVGGGAVAATAAAAVNDSVSRAFVEHTHVLVEEEADVTARSKTVIDNWGASGAGGATVGLAGTAVVTVTNNTTEAYVAESNFGKTDHRVGAVSVTALDDLRVHNRGGSVGVGAGAGIGVAALITSANGRTSATVRDARIYAGSGAGRDAVRVQALSRRDVQTEGGSAGVGAVGLAGTVVLVLSGSRIEGDGAGELEERGDVLGNVSAFTDADRLTVEGDDKNVELAGEFDQDKVEALNAQGRVDLAHRLTRTSDADTEAAVTGNSLIDADGDVDVFAGEEVRIGVTTANAALGAAAVGGSFGLVSVGSSAATEVGPDVSIVSNAGHVSVSARTGRLPGAGRAVSVDVYQGEGGFIALGAAVAYADLVNRVAVKVDEGASLQAAGHIDIAASDELDVHARGYGLSVGAVAAGAVVAVADKSGDVGIDIADGAELRAGVAASGPDVPEEADLTIAARRSGGVRAYTLAAKGGVLLAGTGSVAIAKDEGRSAAVVGDNVHLVAGRGDVVVAASAAPKVKAEAEGVSVSGVLSVGVSVADAAAGTVVHAKVGSAGLLLGRNVTVWAELERGDGQDDYSARSHAMAGSGGGLLGAHATSSRATTTARVQAELGSDVEASGSVQLIAGNMSRQRATVDGFGVGAVAVGANFADAVADTTTRAVLGDVRVTGGQNEAADAERLASSLAVLAVADDDTEAEAVSGGGGVVAGTAAEATVVSGADVESVVGEGVLGAYVLAADVSFGAVHRTRYGGAVDSLQAAVAGASGARSDETVTSRTKTNIGAGSAIFALHADVSALSDVQRRAGARIDAAAGGLLNGSAARLHHKVVQQSDVHVGHGAKMSVIDPGLAVDVVPVGAFTPDVEIAPWQLPDYDEFAAGILSIRAHNRLRAEAGATLNTGGLIDVPSSRVHSDVSVTETASIGDGAVLISSRDLFIEAHADAVTQMKSLTSTAGLAGGAEGRAESFMTGRHRALIGQDATVAAYRYLGVAAGTDGMGFGDYKMISQAITNVFNNTAIPVTTAYANAELDVVSTVHVGSGSELTSVFDTILAASDAHGSALSSGRGIRPAADWLTGEINDSHSNLATRGVVTVDGSVTAGVWNEQRITIGADNNVSFGEHTVAPDIRRTDFNPYATLQREIAELEDALQAARDAGDDELAAQLQAQIDVLEIALESEEKNDESKSVVEILDPVYAAGGDVIVDADAVGGAGRVTAKGAPTIDIVNDSDAYLVVNELLIPERNAGGAIRFIGNATRPSVTGPLSTRLTEIGRDELPSIAVRNTASKQSLEPGIVLQGVIENLQGTVRIFNQSGNIHQLAEMRAQTISIEAPSGAYIANMPGETWLAGGDPIGMFSRFEALPGAQRAAEIALRSFLSGRYAWRYGKSVGELTEEQYNEYLKDPLDYMGSGDKGRALGGGYTWVLSNFPNYFGKFKDVLSGSKSDDAARNPDDYYGSEYDYVWLFGPNNDKPDQRRMFMRKVGMPSLARSGSYDSYIKPPAAPGDSEPGGDDGCSIVCPPGSGNDNRVAPGAILAGGTIAVHAEYIDVNGKMRSGQPTDRTIVIHESLEEWIEGLDPDVESAEVPDDYYSDSIESYVDGIGDGKGNRVRLVYRRGEGIVVEPIRASGGGLVHLSGHIISTNPYGFIEVLGGVGQVEIDNRTSRHLFLDDIYAGTGVKSEVRIFDKNTDTATWYVYEPGYGTTMYTAPFDTRDYSGLTGRLLDSDAEIVYNPMEGQRYEWTRTASVCRNFSWPKGDDGIYSRYEMGSWRFGTIDANGQCNRVDQNDAWTTTRRVTTGKAPGPDLVQVREGNIQHVSKTYNFSGIKPGTPGRGTEPGEREPWTFRVVTGADVTITTSVKADNPIAVSFSGKKTGLIDIQSPGGVTLTGRISNPTGDTRIDARATEGTAGGAVRQLQDALIVTRSLEVRAAAGIGAIPDDGEYDSPLRVELGDGTLTAGNVGAGPVVIDVVAGGLRGGTVWTEQGDVELAAAGGIFDTEVRGEGITLVSRQGALGTAEAPIRLQAAGNVRATADGDVFLRQLAGDLHLVWAGSAGGDVGIYVDEGALHNAAEFALDHERIAELEALFDEWLTGDGFEERTVVPFQNRINAAYEEYWRLRRLGVFDAAGTFVGLSEEGLALYRDRAAAALGAPSEVGGEPPLSDEDVHVYAAELFGEQEELFGAVFGDDWRERSEFVAYHEPEYDEDTGDYSNYYSYETSDEWREELFRGSVWTKNQIELRINENALVPVSDTQVVVQDPNVRGRRVTIEAADDAVGGVGHVDDPIVIVLPEDPEAELDIEDWQKAALLAASLPGDLTLEYDGHRLTSIRVRQLRSIFVDALETLNVVSGGDVYIVGQGDLMVERIQADGDGLVAADNSIVAAAGGSGADDTGPAIAVGGNLALEAGRGSVGSLENPLTVAVGGYLSSARARATLAVEHAGDGDLRFGGLYAGGAALLVNAGGGLIGNVDGAVGPRIDVRSLRVEVAGDFRSEHDEPLRIRVSSLGTLSGAVGGSVRLASTDDELVVGRLEAGGALALQGHRLTLTDRLRAGSDLPDGIRLEASDLLHIGAGASVEIAGSAAGAGGVRIEAGRLFMQADETFSHIVAGRGGVVVHADNDITLGVVQSGGGVDLHAGRALSPGAAGAIVQLAHAFIAADALLVKAAGGISLTGANVVGQFAAENDGSGDIEFYNAGPSLVVGDVTQRGGDVSLTGTETVRVTGVVHGGSDGRVSIAAVGRQEGGVTAGGHVVLAGTAAVVASGRGGISLQAAGDVEMTEGALVATAGGDVFMAAGGSLGVDGRIEAAGIVTLEAGGVITQAEVGGIVGASLLQATSGQGQQLVGLNEVTSFGALNRWSGAVELRNRSDALAIVGVNQRGEQFADGVRIVQIGDLATSGAIDVLSGNVTIEVGSGAGTGDAPGDVYVNSLVRTGRTGSIEIVAAGQVGLVGPVQAERGAIRVSSGEDMLVASDLHNDGPISLEAEGRLDVVGDVGATTGSVTLSGRVGVGFAGTVATSGEVVLTSRGRVEQVEHGRIVGASLVDVAAVGGVLLRGANEAAAFTAVNEGEGDIRFVNTATELRIVNVEQRGDDVIIDQVGAMVVAGDVAAAGGEVLIGATRGSAAGPGAGALDATEVSLRVEGSVRTTGAGAIRLAAVDAVTIQGQLSAQEGAISIWSGHGDVKVSGDLASARGDIAVAAGRRALLSGLISTAASMDVVAGTSIVQGGAGRFEAARVTTVSSEGQFLTGANAISAWSAVNRGGGSITLFNAADTLTVFDLTQDEGDVIIEQVGDLAVSGAVHVADGELAWRTTSGSGPDAPVPGNPPRGDIVIDGAVTVGRGDIAAMAGGAVIVGGAGRLGTGRGTVYVSSEDFVRVDGSVTGDDGDIALHGVSGVAVTGRLAADRGAADIVATHGSILLSGEAAADRMRLAAERGLIQQTAGRIVAAQLVTVTDQGQTLAGENTVRGWFAENRTSGDVMLHNSAALLDVMGISQGGGSVKVVHDGTMRATGAVTTVSGDIDVRATGGLYAEGGVATGAAGAIELRAGGDAAIQAMVRTAAGSIVVTAGENMAVDGSIESSAGLIRLSSGQDMDFFGLAATNGDVFVSAGGSIVNRSLADDAVVHGRDIVLQSGGDIGESDHYFVTDAFRTLEVEAAGDVWLRTIGSLVSPRIVSSGGDVSLLVSSGTARIDELRATAGTVVYEGEGDFVAGRVAARGADVRVGGHGGSAFIGEGTFAEALRLQADVVTVKRLVHDGPHRLRARVSGRDGGRARDVFIAGMSGEGVIFETIRAETARVTLDTDDLQFYDAWIGRVAFFQSGRHSVVVDNVERVLHDADVQLRPGTEPFFLVLGRGRLVLSDADSVHYDDDYIVNRFDTENSYLRSGFKFSLVALEGTARTAVVRMPFPGAGGAEPDRGAPPEAEEERPLLERPHEPLNVGSARHDGAETEDEPDDNA